jgi:hypothetical protein
LYGWNKSKRHNNGCLSDEKVSMQSLEGDASFEKKKKQSKLYMIKD